LREISRIPVCAGCLRRPEPFQAEYFCVSCRTPFQNAFPLSLDGQCALCRTGLRGFDAAYTFGAYDGVLRQLIHLFKYAKIATLAAPLADWMATALPLDERFDLIVPVPLHWRRRWERGFNQSELLVKSLSRRTGISMAHPLTRRRSTAVQAGLSNAGRRRNIQGAFIAKRPARLDGKRILLIDDVMTTGATAAACAGALKRVGAARVALLTVARADRRFDAAPAAAATAITGGRV
jgi:ComF family protein